MSEEDPYKYWQSKLKSGEKGQPALADSDDDDDDVDEELDEDFSASEV